jgi:hypothetical protein
VATIPACQQGIYFRGLFASYFTSIYFGGMSFCVSFAFIGYISDSDCIGYGSR